MADVYTTETTTTSSSNTIYVDGQYVKSLDAICKILEMVFGLCTFISACVWGPLLGGGWVQFVGIFCFIVIGIYFILKLIRVIYKLPASIPVTLIEMITCLVFTVFNLIAGIVAAVIGYYPPAGAAAAFSFFNMVVFGVDSFLKFQEWRSGGGTVVRTSQTSTTTTATVKMGPA